MLELQWKTGEDLIHDSIAPPSRLPLLHLLHMAVQGGEQVINLAEECMEWGVIAHEVLHALGQVHEHNRLRI